jgi:YaiO family outer membrane protein
MLYDALPPPAIDCAAPHEQSAEAMLGAARAARLAGDYSGAECTLTRLIVATPRDADAWLELGLLRAVEGDAQRAEAAFLQVLQIAPDYDDAKIGLARLAYRTGDVAGARIWLARIGPDRAHDPEIEALRAQLRHASRAQWRWDVLAGYSRLSNDLSPWREASVSISRREGQSSLGLGIDYARRFSRTDVYGELRFARGFGATTWSLALGGATRAHFLPEAAARVAFSTREDRDWIFDGALTIARYNVGEVDRFGLRATRRFGDALRFNAQGILVRDETDELRSGYAVGGAWRFRDRLELSLAWSDAPESSEGVTLDVRGVELGLAADVTPRLRVRVSALHEQRDAFDRDGVMLAFTRTF